MRTRPTPEHLLSCTVGTFLVLIGLVFVVFTVVFATSASRRLPGYVQGALFGLAFGIALVWIGWTFLRLKPERERKAGMREWLDIRLLAYRRELELLAATACGLMLARVAALCVGVDWPPAGLLWALTSAPAAIGLLTLKILAPGAFQSGLFANEAWHRWSPGARLVVQMVLRVGWIGYVAAFLAMLDLCTGAFGRWRPAAQIVASSLVSLLYASHVLVLHFGRVRERLPRPSQ